MKLEQKHYNWIILGAITLTGYYLYNRKKTAKNKLVIENKKPQLYNDYKSSSLNEELGINQNESPFPIQMGSKGDAVKAIQKYMNSTCPSDLKSEGLYPLDVNGIWDDNTERATLACSILKRNKIDKETFDRILRDLQSANIDIL